MQIGICISGQVVVDGQVYTFNVDTAAEDISRNAYALVEFFEFLVAFDTIIVSLHQ